MMESSIFKTHLISYNEDDSFQAYRNFCMVVDGLTVFYEGLHGIKSNEPEAGMTLVFQLIASIKNKLATMKNDINQTSIRSIN